MRRTGSRIQRAPFLRPITGSLVRFSAAKVLALPTATPLTSLATLSDLDKETRRDDHRLERMLDPEGFLISDDAMKVKAVTKTESR